MDRIFLAIVVGSLLALVTSLALVSPPTDVSVPALTLKERVGKP
jgi:hypothetical protein